MDHSFLSRLDFSYLIHKLFGANLCHIKDVSRGASEAFAHALDVHPSPKITRHILRIWY